VDLTRLSGRYEFDGSAIGVSTGETGITEIQSSDHWDAVGFFDGVRFAGLIRKLDDEGAPIANADYEPLRFELQQDGSITAVRGANGSGTALRMERWTREEVKRGKSEKVTPDAATTEPPKFGEYIYVEELPEAITKVPPVYPAEARDAGVDGTVIVQVLIGRDGLVLDTKIVKSIPLLDRAAADCVRQWVFKPALTKNKPIAVWVAIPVRFSLH